MKGWLWSRRQETGTEAGERDGTWMQQKDHYGGIQ